MSNLKNLKSFRIIIFILIIGVINLSTGCHYYKTVPYNKSQEGLDKVIPGDYMIIHYADQKWHLDNVSIDRKTQIIKGIKMNIQPMHLNNDKPGKMTVRYKPKQKSPENEVHLYINSYQQKDNGYVLIDISEINRVDIYDKNIGATIASYVLGGIITSAVIFVIIIIIIMLVKSSCPFIYIYEDGQYKFVGEIFGGAIAKNMERDDYMELPGFKPLNGEYKIMITNELKERQYTDIAQLIVVEHPENTNVMLDKKGEIQFLNNAVSPISVISEQGIDHKNELAEVDDHYYAFLDENKKKAEFSSIIMKFPNTTQSENGKLHLHLKNTMWLEFAFDSYNEQFGDKFEKFAEIRAKSPKEKNVKWSEEQGLPLAVKLKTKDGWQHVDYIDMVGPLASRNVVVPIKDIDAESKTVEVKLECGFHFWEIDHAEMDFSDDHYLKTYTIDCESAIDELGMDVKKDLLKVDQNYMSQLKIGNEAYLSYPAPESPVDGNIHSAFLYTRGYYEPIREYQGKAKLWKLIKMWEKGSFPKFAKENFDQFSIEQ